MGQCLIHRTSVPFKAFIKVFATPNSTVTASLNGTVMDSQVADSTGETTLTVKKKGTYSVTSNASGTQTKNVVVSVRKETVEVNVTGNFTLTLTPQSINNLSAATISANRTSSPYGKAGTGNLLTGAAIYYGDIITISVGVRDANVYNTAILTINNVAQPSGTTSKSITIDGDVIAQSTTTVKSYKVTFSGQSINQISAAVVTVNRTESPNRGANPGNLTTNADIFYGDKLTITASVTDTDVYNTPTLTVDGSALAAGTVTKDVIVTKAVSASATTTVKNYKLSITIGKTATNQETATVTVKRSSSPKQGADSNVELSHNAVIYYGDVLTITAAVKDVNIYKSLTLKVDSKDFTSGNTHTVKAAVAVNASAVVKSFTFSLSHGSGSSLSVTRTSPYQGATSGALTDGATVYYGDIISKSGGSASTGFNSYNITPSGLSYASGKAATGPWTVTNNCSLTSSASPIKYTLTSSGINSNYAVTVKRTARGTAGAAAGVSVNVNLSNGAAIYYDDTLSFTPSAATNYNGNYSVTGLDSNISSSTSTATGKKVRGNVTVTSSAWPQTVTLYVQYTDIHMNKSGSQYENQYYPNWQIPKGWTFSQIANNSTYNHKDNVTMNNIRSHYESNNGTTSYSGTVTLYLGGSGNNYVYVKHVSSYGTLIGSVMKYGRDYSCSFGTWRANALATDAPNQNVCIYYWHEYDPGS